MLLDRLPQPPDLVGPADIADKRRGSAKSLRRRLQGPVIDVHWRDCKPIRRQSASNRGSDAAARASDEGDL
jgi:hypothetical protein